MESDVESLPALNPDNTDNEPSLVEEDMPIVDLFFGAIARAALQGLDDVDLEAEFCTRACVMKSPPAFLRGHYRSTMRFALSEWTGHGTGMTQPEPPELGSCFYCSLVCCSTAQHVEATFRVSLEGSFSAFAAGPTRVGSVQNSVQFRLADDKRAGGDDIQRRERQRLWSNLENCHQGTLLKELRYLLANATLTELQDPEQATSSATRTPQRFLRAQRTTL